MESLISFNCWQRDGEEGESDRPCTQRGQTKALHSLFLCYETWKGGENEPDIQRISAILSIIMKIQDILSHKKRSLLIGISFIQRFSKLKRLH